MIEREDVDGSWAGGEHEALAWPVTPDDPKARWRGACVCGWNASTPRYHASRATADAEEHVRGAEGVQPRV